MAGIAAGYDLSVSTFSPDGRVFQVEYAAKAVDNGGATLAFRCSDGIVCAAEKVLKSPMVISRSDRRIYPIDQHMAIAVCGWLPDGQNLVNKAIQEAANYKRVFGEAISGDVLAKRIALYVHAYTLYWSVRPFGASLVLLSAEQGASGGNLFSVFGIEPPGTAYEYQGHAYGRGRQTAKTELEKLDGTCTCEEAAVHLVRIMYQIMEENSEANARIEIGFLRQGEAMKLLDEEVIKQMWERAAEEYNKQ